MAEYCRPMYDGDTDIHFLFETEKWNGTLVKDMETSHIINSALMLLRRANEFKLNYELFLIDHKDGKLLKTVDDINEIAKMDAETWVKTTPIFVAFLKELSVRNLLSYFDIVLDRIAKSKENK